MRVLSLVILAALLLGAGLAAGPRRAAASDWWCWDDPILVINNQAVQILAGVPTSLRGSVRGAELTVIVPEGVDARITATVTAQFPLSARLVRAGAVAPDGTVTVMAVLSVQSSADMPTALRIRQASGVEQIGYGTSATTAAVSLTLQQRANVAPRVAPQGAPSRVVPQGAPSRG